MSTQEELIAKFKALRLRKREEETIRLQSAEAHGIRYSAVHRLENMRLLRAFINSTQKDFATLLSIDGGQTKYSQLERGEQDLLASEARRIERELGIPDNWLDRSNSHSLFMSQDEQSLINEIRGANPGAALALADAVKQMSGRS
jgi:transcriptional regulator with XRE-family HTH domain